MLFGGSGNQQNHQPFKKAPQPPPDITGIEANPWTLPATQFTASSTNVQPTRSTLKTPHEINLLLLNKPGRSSQETPLALQQGIVQTTKMNPLQQNHFTQRARHPATKTYVASSENQFLPYKTSQSCLQYKKCHSTADD